MTPEPAPTARRPSGAARATLVFVASLLVVAAIYWPGLNGPLVLDDVANLGTFRALAGQGRLTFANALADEPDLLSARPVAVLTFLMSWRLSGDDVWSLKLANLALHLVCGVAIFALARVLLPRFAVTGGRRAAWAAAWVALAWMLTPMQVSTVLYVVQRMAQLAALFCLLGVLCYSAGRLRLDRRPLLGGSLIALSLLVFWPLATLSKQNGAVLPLLLLATELAAFRDVGAARPRRVLTLVLAAAALAPALLLAAFVVADPAWLTAPYAIRDFTLGERLLTQPRVLLDYAAGVLQLPGASPLGLFRDDVVASRGLLSPWTTAVAVAVWVFAVAAAVVAAAVGRRGRGIVFGLLFFLAAHLVEAGPFPLELYFEHRNYLPSVGLFFAAALALDGAATRLSRPRAIATVAVAVLLIYALPCAARVLAWTSWESIVDANLRAHPRSVRARAGAAIVALRDGRLADGLERLDEVERIGGGARFAGVALKRLVGYCLARQSPPADVYARLEHGGVAGDDPYTVGALRWLRTQLESEPCPTLDLQRVAAALERSVSSRTGAGAHGGNWALHFESACLSALAGRRAAARRGFEAAWRHAPPSTLPEIRARIERLRRP